MYYCLRIGDNCLTCQVDNDIMYVSGSRLQQFSITVGRNDGAYKKCGLSRNRMETAQTTAFMCEANARGKSVKIQIQKMEVLSLCEVFIFGRGTVEVKCCTATNKL